MLFWGSLGTILPVGTNGLARYTGSGLLLKYSCWYSLYGMRLNYVNFKNSGRDSLSLINQLSICGPVCLNTAETISFYCHHSEVEVCKDLCMLPPAG